LAHVLCCAPGANAATKKLLLASAAQPSGELLDQAAEWFGEAVTGAEGVEGTMAFVQKRKPGWAL
jgi:isohexenylglutaconyl-CoA hydratase